MELPPGVDVWSAAAFGEHETLRALLAARVAASGCSLADAASAADDTGSTPLIEAAKHGHAECVALLLTAGAPVAARDAMRRTALHHAAAGGHRVVVARLVAAGAPVAAVDAGGRTALHFASAHGHDGVATTLVGAGADAARVDASGAPALAWLSAFPARRSTAAEAATGTRAAATVDASGAAVVLAPPALNAAVDAGTPHMDVS